MRARTLLPAFRIGFPAAVFLLLVARQFSPDHIASSSAFGWRLWLVVAVAAVLGARVVSVLRRGRDDEDVRDEIEVAALTLTGVNVLVQMCGAELRPLVYPLNYLLLSLFVVYFGPRLAGALTLALLLVDALETAVFRGAAPVEFPVVGPETWTWSSVGARFAVSLAFVGLVGLLLLGERRLRDRAVATLNRLQSDADDLAPGAESALPAVLRDTMKRGDVTHTRGLDAELADLMDIGRLAVRADVCVFLMRTSDGGFLRVRALSGTAADVDDEAVLPVDSALPALVLRRRETIVIAHLEPERGIPEYRRRRQLARSLMASPVETEAGPIGLIAADSLRESAFDASDKETFSRLADRVAGAFTAARAVAGITRERTEYAAFFNFAKRFADTLTVDDVVSAAFEAAEAVAPFDAAVVHLSEPEAPTGRIVALRGLPERSVGLEIPRAESLAGRAVSTRRILSFRRPVDPTTPLYHPDLTLRAYESGMVIPLEYRGRAVGTAGFFWRRPDAFTDYERRLFESLVGTMAIALNDARQYEQMELLATTDGLTELPNHRTFQAVLTDEMKRFERLHSPLSLVLLDIDHFKGVNDTHGHPVGDQVLKAVAATLRAEVRSIDVAARYGGEEFVLILPSTKPAGAKKFADRVRRHVADLAISTPRGPLSVTVSMGIAGCPEDATRKQDLIDLADKALYHSKQNGRNRVTWIAEVDR